MKVASSVMNEVRLSLFMFQLTSEEWGLFPFRKVIQFTETNQLGLNGVTRWDELGCLGPAT